MTTDRISLDPKIFGGKPCIKGTRIPVAMVLEVLEDGITFEQVIQDFYPQLTREDIRACLEYAKAVIEGEEFHSSLEGCGVGSEAEVDLSPLPPPASTRALH